MVMMNIKEENTMKHYWVSYFSQRTGSQSGCTIIAKDDDEFGHIWETEYEPRGYEIADWGCDGEITEEDEYDFEITAADLHDYMYGI